MINGIRGPSQLDPNLLLIFYGSLQPEATRRRCWMTGFSCNFGSLSSCAVHSAWISLFLLFPDPHWRVISLKPSLPSRAQWVELACVSTASGPLFHHGTFHTVTVLVSISPAILHRVFVKSNFIFLRLYKCYFFMAKLRITLILILPKSQWIIKI